MGFSVPCVCGIAIDVTAAQAGSVVVCRCGRAVAIPRLSELRQAVGMGAFEAGTIQTIQRMIKSGELPEGDTCLRCGLPTRECHDISIVCEHRWMTGPGEGRNVFAAISVLFFPFLLIYLLIAGAFRTERRGERGRNVAVRVPLRICSACEPDLRRWRSQRKLQKVVAKVPIYAKLLTEYRGAKILASEREASEALALSE